MVFGRATRRSGRLRGAQVNAPEAALGPGTRSRGQRALLWLCDVTTRRPWAVILLCLLVVLGCAGGLTSLKFNPDTRAFLGNDNPEALALAHIENSYSKAGTLAFILTAEKGDVFSAESGGLAAIETLTEMGWQLPHSTRVESLANYQHSYAEGDDLIIESLYEDAAALDTAGRERIRDIVLSNEELRSHLISEDSRVTGVTAFILKPERNAEAVRSIATEAREIAAEIESRYPQIDVRLSGSIMSDVAFGEAGRDDMKTLMPIMLVLVFLVLTIGFRSLSATAATLLIVAGSVIGSLGLASWAGIELTAGTGGTPVIIMTLCIADCVHFVTSLAHYARTPGLSRNAAVQEALRVNFSPIFITSLTTAIGFLSLNWSEAPPLRDLGNMVAVGVTFAFLFSVTFMPAFFTLVPYRKQGGKVMGEGLAHALSRFVIARNRVLLWVGIAVTLGLSAGLSQVVLDDDFVAYFDESYEFRRDTDYLQEKLTGLHALNFSLPAGEEYGITDPDYLRKIEAFEDWYLTQDKVSNASGLPEVIKRLHMNLNGDDPAFRTIPDSKELAAQLLLLYELSVPFGRDLNQQINVEKSESRFTVWLRDASSVDIRRLAAAGEAWLRENAPELYTPAAGVSVVYAHISETNIKSMLRGTFVALVVISFILILLFRSLRIGLLSLVPNLAPAFMAFGLWGYLYQEVNLAVSIVGAITLGIVVDDTVHFLTKYLRARRESGMPPREAVEYTFRTVGVALIQTSVALVLGFAVLAQSGFAISADMGLLSAIVILIALVADLMILPPLLLLLERNR